MRPYLTGVLTLLVVVGLVQGGFALLNTRHDAGLALAILLFIAAPLAFVAGGMATLNAMTKDDHDQD